MNVVVDAGMSGRWCQVSSFLLLVTMVFGCIISKARDLCGRVLCVLFIWLVRVCLWLGVCYGVGAVFLVT